MTKRSLRTPLIVGCSFLLALAAAVAILGRDGAGSEALGSQGLGLGLMATARLAFVLFWMSYVAGPLVTLFGSAFLPLRRLGRDFGLAFAAVLLVHLSIVARLCWIGDSPSLSTFLLFGSAAIAAYSIVLLSFRTAVGHLSAGVVRGIRWAGMNLIAYAFAVDFLRDPLSGGTRHIVIYLPFAFLSLVGPGLRIAASFKYLHGLLRNSPYRMG